MSGLTDANTDIGNCGFAPFPCHPSDRCFACNRTIGRLQPSIVADTRDGQLVYVGTECAKKITKAGDAGYQPPKGGPRLYALTTTPESN